MICLLDDLKSTRCEQCLTSERPSSQPNLSNILVLEPRFQLANERQHFIDFLTLRRLADDPLVHLIDALAVRAYTRVDGGHQPISDRIGRSQHGNVIEDE